ncbi:MAG: hypothetical protein AAFQ41_02435 [Cyanobacteria bacterium J06623_7]
MPEGKFTSQADRTSLANPVEGRIYLKAALNKGSEQDLLEALHDIIDSLNDAEDESSEVFSLPLLKAA